MQALGEPLSRMKKLCEAVSAHLDVLRAGAIYRQEREVALDSRAPGMLSIFKLPMTSQQQD